MQLISCTPGHLSDTDSILYMNGGDSEFVQTIANQIAPPGILPLGMVWIPGGEFSMGGVNPVGMGDGSGESMDDATPVRRIRVHGFLMDATEVTNKEFAAFVKATDYKTVAETKPTKEEFPTVNEEDLVAGSILFSPVVVSNLNDHYQWWRYVYGANWRHPRGREVLLMTGTIFLLCTLHGKMQRLMQNGRVNEYQRKGSGSLQPGAEIPVNCMPGVASLNREENGGEYLAG